MVFSRLLWFCRRPSPFIFLSAQRRVSPSFHLWTSTALMEPRTFRVCSSFGNHVEILCFFGWNFKDSHLFASILQSGHLVLSSSQDAVWVGHSSCQIVWGSVVFCSLVGRPFTHGYLSANSGSTPETKDFSVIIPKVVQRVFGGVLCDCWCLPHDIDVL